MNAKVWFVLYGVLMLSMVSTPADAIRYCLYEDASCSQDEQCVDVTAGNCITADEIGAEGDGSVKIECVDAGLKTTFWASNDCTGTAFSNTLNGTDGECVAFFGDSYKWDCSAGGADCFAADGTVELVGGEIMRMDKLKIGDVVRVSASEFSPVYFWGHKDSSSTSGNFVQIMLESGRTLTLSSNHMLYANKALVRAVDVQVGDTLVDAHNGDSIVSDTRRGVTKRGLYNPHTIHGDIVVNGVVASTYTSAQLSPTAHMLLAIERLSFRLGLSVFGSMLESQRPAVLNWYLRTFGSVY